MKNINEIKSEIQRQGHLTWYNAGRRGTIAAGTGFGKSRLAILETQRMKEANELDGPNQILLVTPTEKLRDINWPQEFIDWGAAELFTDHVKPICFASLKKEKGQHYKLVILDEIHRITDLSATAFEAEDDEENALMGFFSDNLADAVMGLTATVPSAGTEPEKVRIINQVAPIVFTYTLDQGVEDGMIADYSIRVIMLELDDTKKVIPAGSKAKPFFTTEKKAYEYLEKSIRKFRAMAAELTDVKLVKKYENMMFMKTMERNRFIAALPSKQELAKRCLKQIHGQGKRTLVFCGNIQQAEELLAPNTYHSKRDSKAFEQFNNLEIDILGVVNAANEGINFNLLDQALILQMDSNPRNMTQRIGRCLRTRDGHKAIIYILCAMGTVDDNWRKKSLEPFDPSKITFYESKMVPA